MIARTAAAAAMALGLALPASAGPEVAAGAYLAARQASLAEDFPAASVQYDRLLAAYPENPRFLESAVIAHIGTGDMAGAAEFARRLAQTGSQSGVAALARMTADVGAGDYDAILAEIASGTRYAPLVDDILRAWALFGAGQTDAAGELLDAAVAASAQPGFRLFNKALMLALSGDAAGALAMLEAAPDPARDAVIARVELLSQMDRGAEAQAVLDEVLLRTNDPAINDLQARLAAGETLQFDVVRSPAEAIGLVFHIMASAFRQQDAPTEALIYARIAQTLHGRDPGTSLITAEILEDLGHYTLATEAYRQVDPAAPAYFEAEIGRASALLSAGREEAAVEVLSALLRTHGDRSEVQTAMGNLMRRLDRYEEAVTAYDAALALHPLPDAVHWGLYYARGMMLERAGHWDRAEADLTRALEIEPDQPDVLNYLGYALVERRERLDDALAMIETAVAAEPDAGHIVDSLGWALYRLGRFDEAVAPMERAAALMPVDPVVNDHLGDVYWMVGRQREARFQWRRALSFGPEEAEAERIRAKLETGLDVVLAAEAEAGTGTDDR